MANEQPLVVKKVKKNKGHGHHGGAYADFVTAMMAFFLLMWLLGSTTEETRRGISEYFQDPYEATRVDKGKIPSLDEVAPTEIDHQADDDDELQLKKLQEKIEAMIDENSNLSAFKDQIKIDRTEEGLRVQIIDNSNTPMFKLASSEAEPQIQLILKELAPVINKLPNKITVNGHTDARPYPPNRKGYSNWELSSDRANAARYELTHGGLAEEKILRVTGLSDSIPYNPADPLDPMNRRISIIVMNKKTERHVLKEEGSKPAADNHAASPAAQVLSPENVPENPQKTETDSPPPETEPH
jgi:chemotaxis protein MotB